MANRRRMTEMIETAAVRRFVLDRPTWYPIKNYIENISLCWCSRWNLRRGVSSMMRADTCEIDRRWQCGALGRMVLFTSQLFLVKVRATVLRLLYPTSLSYGVDISSCIAYLKGALFGRSLCDWLESAACSIVGFQIRACFRWWPVWWSGSRANSLLCTWGCHVPGSDPVGFDNVSKVQK
jgi:hypothetical protein